MSSSGGSGSGGLSVATAHLTAAQISTLFSVPVELVAAPGADRVTIVLGVEYETVGDGSAWVATSGGIYYEGVAGASTILNADLPQTDMLGGFGVSSQLLLNGVIGFGGETTDTYANKAVVVTKPTADPARSAPISTLSIAAPGAGYVAGDTGTIDDATFGADTGYVVDTVGALGVVLTLHLALSAAGYDPAAGPFTTTAGGAQAGIGTGLEINVLTIAAATGDLYVTAYYRTITTH